jgi:hypothetical protein
VHVERQLLFLYSMKKGKKKKVRPCWDIRKCSPLLRKICIHENPSNCRYCIERMVTPLERKIGSGFGDTVKNPNRVSLWEEKAMGP